MKKKTIDTTPFDRFRMPPRQNLFLMPLIWLICFILTRRGRLRIRRVRMKGLKPPYLVIGSHHAFIDFYITPLALWPHRANYISELEGFENFGEWIYRQVGCLGTRKFINDLALIRNIKRVMDRKGILVLYPEARYANVGTNSVLPESVGKLAKMLGVPVVGINMHGNYLQSPIWNLKTRGGVRLDTEIAQLMTKDELAALSAAEVTAKIQQFLTYDEYAWQYGHQMKIDYPKRAEGLELVLYQCRDCGAEFQMAGDGAELYCKACGSRYHMDELGRLQPGDIHIPDWYEWQRSQVAAGIEAGRYGLDTRVQIEALPNAVNFIDCGEGRLVHSTAGFELHFFDPIEETDKTLKVPAKDCPSVHTEYDYRSKKGPCITLSTLDNTYFIFPKEEGFNPTKIQFAAEYLFGKRSV
jgi:1-acyl-sn-glycerol-3-phosphate acyltransferase